MTCISRNAIRSMVLLGSLLGCQTTEDITKRRQLMDQDVSGPISVLTTDSTLYRLERYELRENILRGVGTSTKGSVTAPWRGEIWISQISYAQARSFSFFKTLLAVGAVGFISYTLADALESPTGSAVQVNLGFYDPNTYGGGGGGGGGSCPFIYSWDGDGYRLEGEAFSVALGRGLEFASHHVLQHLEPTSGVLRLRIANRRFETHYVNSVRLFGIDAPPGCEVFSDPRGNFWSVRALLPPREGVDRSGRDVTPLLAGAGDLLWESDGTGSVPGGDYEDRLTLTFDRPPRAAEGTLVVRAINTRLSEAGFGYLGEFLGDQALPFLQQMESDPQLIQQLRGWIKETSLTIEVWDGTAWQLCDRIIPEANEVGFAHAVRVHVPDGLQGTLRLRLRTLADVWKIDQVGVDWTVSAPCRTREIPMSSAFDAEGNSVLQALDRDDREYVVVLPPQVIDLQFTDPARGDGGGGVYAVRVGGYLLEWMAEPREERTHLLPGEARLALARELIARKELLLPPVYAAWTAMKRGE